MLLETAYFLWHDTGIRWRHRSKRFVSKGFIMDKNRIEGAAKELKGTIKEAAGKLTGNDKLEAEGKADKVAGNAQSAVGKGKDAVRDALK
jgi:uncharacterized protein YjbJ (UPF0337 family)